MTSSKDYATSDLVSTQWLNDHLGSPDLCIVDASWYLPAMNRDAKGEFLTNHILHAQFFDIDALSDQKSPLPHMLPPPEQFSVQMRRLGIGDGKRVVCYDGMGLFSAARAWWMFKVFGHEDVAVLDGGLPKWLKEGRPVEDGPARPVQPRHFTARHNGTMESSLADVQQALATGSAQWLDARPAPRFRGEVAEPRPGVRPGHAPGQINVPWSLMLNDDGTVKSRPALEETFRAQGVDLHRPTIASCGSGVSGCSLALALTLIGHHHHTLYDGAWSEWGARDDLPAVTGA
jgi:thiosulfate/3-mercaptopyruvate sulfurtransferase